MEQLVLGLYALSLVACCVCLWFWYELESMKDYVNELRARLMAMDDRLDSVEKKRR